MLLVVRQTGDIFDRLHLPAPEGLDGEQRQVEIQPGEQGHGLGGERTVVGGQTEPAPLRVGHPDRTLLKAQGGAERRQAGGQGLRNRDRLDQGRGQLRHRLQVPVLLAEAGLGLFVGQQLPADDGVPERRRGDQEGPLLEGLQPGETKRVGRRQPEDHLIGGQHPGHPDGGVQQGQPEGPSAGAIGHRRPRGRSDGPSPTPRAGALWPTGSLARLMTPVRAGQTI